MKTAAPNIGAAEVFLTIERLGFDDRVILRFVVVIVF